MQTSLILSTLALLLAGAACLGTLASPSALLLDSAPLDPAADANAGLVARLVEVEEECRALRARLSMIEGAPEAPRVAVPSGGAVSHEEFEAFREEVLAALAAVVDRSTLAASLAAPDVKGRIADTLQEIRRDETAAAIETWRQRRLDGLDKRMARLETELGLTGGQSGDLRAELEAQYARDAELSERWKLGEEDEAALGEVKATNHQVHQNALRRILSPAQLEVYAGLSASGGK